MKNRNKYSIKTQLLSSLLIPLFCLSLLSAAVIYWLAINMSQGIHDELLLSAADSVLARINLVNNKIVVDLPEAAQALLKHHDKDKFYYEISKADGTCVFGENLFPNVAGTPGTMAPICRDDVIRDERVRIAAVDFPMPELNGRYLVVEVAETYNSRNGMAHQILLSVIVLQSLFMICGAIAIWFGIGRGTAPLQAMREAIANRNPYDLQPLTIDHAPEEIMPLMDAINLVLSQLRSHIDAQARFSSNAAHQLRTPLAGIKTYSELGAKISKEPKVVEIFEKVNGGIDRMTHLVNRLLTLARIERTISQPGTNIILDLNMIASDAITELVSYSMNREIQIDYFPSDEPAYISGDAASLRDLVANLVHNAICYTPENGQIVVLIQSSEFIELIVDDSGPGIPEESREKVFERFYRVLGTNVEGSGLGLSIVREIVEAHRGKIELQDSPLGGLRVLVLLNKVYDLNAYPNEIRRNEQNLIGSA
jgi:two-component system sensor histidine kinase TctE